jgi:predicted nucleic acid-binding protein
MLTWTMAAGATMPVVVDASVLIELLLRTQRRATGPPSRQAVDDLLDAHVRRLPTLPLLPAAWTLRASVSSLDAATSPWPGTLGAHW